MVSSNGIQDIEPEVIHSPQIDYRPTFTFQSTYNRPYKLNYVYVYTIFAKRYVDFGHISLDFDLILFLHVYFSKAHPWNRRYSARIKTSNVYNTWAPVKPIMQGTSCAG